MKNDLHEGKEAHSVPLRQTMRASTKAKWCSSTIPGTRNVTATSPLAPVLLHLSVVYVGDCSVESIRENRIDSTFFNETIASDELGYVGFDA